MVSIDRWSLDQPTVVSIDRWSLCRGAIVLSWWSLDQPTVVSIDRWSLRQVSLYTYVQTPTLVQSTVESGAFYSFADRNSTREGFPAEQAIG